MPSRLSERFFIFLRRWIPKNPLWWRVWPNQFIFAIHNDRYNTAGGLTIDCNLFTMARACVRKVFCLVTVIFRPYQDSVGDKTCSTKDFECQHVGIPFTIFHPWWGAFFRCPAKQINCRKTLARVKVIARSNWSSEIVGSSHHRKKGILLSTWSARWRCERFVLGARWLYNFFLRSCRE